MVVAYVKIFLFFLLDDLAKLHQLLRLVLFLLFRKLYYAIENVVHILLGHLQLKLFLL